MRAAAGAPEPLKRQAAAGKSRPSRALRQRSRARDLRANYRRQESLLRSGFISAPAPTTRATRPKRRRDRGAAQGRRSDRNLPGGRRTRSARRRPAARARQALAHKRMAVVAGAATPHKAGPSKTVYVVGDLVRRSPGLPAAAATSRSLYRGSRCLPAENPGRGEFHMRACGDAMKRRSLLFRSRRVNAAGLYRREPAKSCTWRGQTPPPRSCEVIRDNRSM